MQSQQNFLAVVAVSHGDDATRDDGVRVRGGPPWPRIGHVTFCLRLPWSSTQPLAADSPHSPTFSRERSNTRIRGCSPNGRTVLSD